MPGPKPLPFDKKIFEGACRIQATYTEIASLMGMSHDTLSRRVKKEYGMTFEDAYKIYSEHGKMSLRRTQLKLAETNASMAIWLGKQMLGQTDEPKKEKPEMNIMQALLDGMNEFKAEQKAE